MSGRIDCVFIAIFTLSALAIITDLLFNKIYNWLTFPAVLIGLLFGFYTSGFHGLGQAFLGLFLGFSLYIWMFGLGWIGAGDVKLLMAIGTWGGWYYTAEVAVLAILIGALMGLVALVVKGRFRSFFDRMFLSFLSLTLKELEFQPPRVDSSLKMPFGISIGIAAVWNILSHPFGSL